MKRVLISSKKIIRKFLAWRLKLKQKGPKVNEFNKRKEAIIECFSENIPIKEGDKTVLKTRLKPKYQNIIILDYFQYLKHRKFIVYNSDITSLKKTRLKLTDWLDFYEKERLTINPNPIHLQALIDNENMIKELINLIDNRLNDIDFPAFCEILTIEKQEFENAIKPLRTQGFFTHIYYKQNVARLIFAMVELGYINHPIKHVQQREALAKSIYQFLGIEDSTKNKYQQFRTAPILTSNELQEFKELFSKSLHYTF